MSNVKSGIFARDIGENHKGRQKYSKMNKKTTDRTAELCKAFEGLVQCDGNRFNLYAIRIDHVDVNGEISYSAHSLSIQPKEDWMAYLKEVGTRYVGVKKPIIADDFDVKKYDGTPLEENEAFVIPKSDGCVKKCFKDFSGALMDASVEHRAESIKPNATAICNGEKTCIFLSVRSPFSILKHKFWWADTAYERITENILTLSTKIDAVIIDDKLYFLTIAGAQAFVSESICKTVAQEKAESIANLKYISGAETLKAISLTGLNPRRYLGYNADRVDDLHDQSKRQKIAKTFGIKYVKGKFDLADEGDAERFIKVICNKGMIDPFKAAPVEVTSSKPWKG